MNKILVFTCLTFSLFGCSSSDDSNNQQTFEDLSNLLTQNAWVYDNAEIIDITNHGTLSYAEAEQILLDNPLNSSNSTVSITNFDSDGTGSIITPNSSVETINFGWIILPDNTLRLFLSSSLNDLGVFEFTINDVLLTLINDQEYLYQGTLIKYKVKGNYNKQ